MTQTDARTIKEQQKKEWGEAGKAGGSTTIASKK